MIGISVIICARNPRRAYLLRVLQGLQHQTLSRERWELLLVDNASNEPLVDVFDLKWHLHGRHIREMSIGLTQARLRAIREAKAPLLVFVDDDNILDVDYLAHAQTIASEHPNLGVWSGNVRLEFERPPPEWTKPYWHLLVAREVPKDMQSRSDTDTPSTPYGAGMCMRRQVGMAYSEQLLQSPIRQAFGRCGATLNSSEDIDIALTACDLGMDVGIFARLHITHLIPPERLTEDYLVRLCRGITRSLWLLRFVRGTRLHRVPRGFKWWIKFLYDSARKRGKARRFYVAEVLGKRDAWLSFVSLDRQTNCLSHRQEHSQMIDPETDSRSLTQR